MQFVYLLTILWFQFLTAQSSREIDSLLQEYAFKALTRPRSGIVYDAAVPSNLTGVEVAALRLRSGSLRRKGVSTYKEFHIPAGVAERPYVERLVLVYHNFASWSSFYFPLRGYTFLAPVLGLLAYDATDLTAKNLPELEIQALGDPISIDFTSLLLNQSKESSPICVSFGLNGLVGFDNVINGSSCLTTNQGHFSIVTRAVVPPTAAPLPAGVGGGGAAPRGGDGKGVDEKVWIVVACVVGGILAFAFLIVLFVCLKRCLHRKRIRGMQRAAEGGVELPMTTVGSTKAPVASGTRTKPVLENEYLP